MRISDWSSDVCSSDLAQVDINRLVLDGTDIPRHAHGGVEFGGMALAVRHAQRVHGETLLACDGEDDGGIHATGDEDDGFFHGNRKSGIVKRYRPGSSSHGRNPKSVV